jgi:hypothetical protein
MSAEFLDTSEEDARIRAVVENADAKKQYVGDTIAAMVRAAQSGPVATVEVPLDVPEAELRSRLRETIAARNKAHEKFKKAANAVTKADGMLALAETGLRRLDGIDGEIAGYRAAQIRDEIDSGTAASLALPPELSDRLKSKQEAEARIAAIGSAKAQQLQPALDEARDRLAGAQLAVEDRARDILLAQEPALRKQLEEAHACAAELADRLAGLERSSRPQHPRAHFDARSRSCSRCATVAGKMARRFRCAAPGCRRRAAMKFPNPRRLCVEQQAAGRVVPQGSREAPGRGQSAVPRKHNTDSPCEVLPFSRLGADRSGGVTPHPSVSTQRSAGR